MMLWMVALLASAWCGYALWGRRWRIAPMLPARRGGEYGLVVAVVPARNEADQLPSTLPSLLGQTYAPLAVIVVDDHSGDATADVALTLGRQAGAAARLQVLRGADLPPRWMGKVWAQHQGVQRAGEMGAEWIWLTDADIRHDADVLERLLALGRDRDRDFVSIMARLRCDNFYEKLLIPAFTYFFAGLFPFATIGDDHARSAGAAGGCMLIRRSLLERAGGMAAIRDAVIDDVSLAEACKGAGGRLWLGYDRGVNSTRGYETLASIWDMVARSAYTQLRYNPLALAGSVIGLLLVFLLPIGAALFGSGALRVCGLVAYAAMVATYVPMVRYLGCNAASALLLPVAALLYTAMTVSSAWRYYQGTRTHWKGRAYGTSP